MTWSELLQKMIEKLEIAEFDVKNILYSLLGNELITVDRSGHEAIVKLALH